MKSLANSKTVVSLLGTGVTNGATVTANIDRRGFDYVSIDVVMGTADVTSNNPSVLKIAESDDTVVTNFANVSGLVGDTDFTIAAADTSNPNVYRLNIDCKARKRYLKLSVSPTTTQQTVMVARLGNASVAADASATKAGVTQLVNV
jgi:hypothetical protein